MGVADEMDEAFRRQVVCRSLVPYLGAAAEGLKVFSERGVDRGFDLWQSLIKRSVVFFGFRKRSGHSRPLVGSGNSQARNATWLVCNRALFANPEKADEQKRPHPPTSPM